jgi:nicotinamidase-related amidase
MAKYALLVVDVQNGVYSEKAYPADKLLANIGRLADTCREKGVEVIYVVHNDEELKKDSEDWQVVSDIAPKAGEMIVNKNHNSAFLKTGLKEYLTGKGITTVVLTGMVTQYCINATCLAAFEHGFEVIVPEDANAAYSAEHIPAEDVHRLFNRNIWDGGIARVIDTEEAVRMIRELR